MGKGFESGRHLFIYCKSQSPILPLSQRRMAIPAYSSKHHNACIIASGASRRLIQLLPILLILLFSHLLNQASVAAVSAEAGSKTEAGHMS